MPKQLAPRCFIAEEPNFNKKLPPDTSHYGELIPLFKRNGIRPSIFDTERICQELEKKLEEYNYDPEVDYILIFGSVTLVANLTALIGNIWGEFNALVYNNQQDCFYPNIIGRSTYVERVDDDPVMH